MKPIIQKIWMVMAMLCLSISASAYDFEVDGIEYTITTSCSVKVMAASPSNGDIINIPSIVVNGNKEYVVTSISSKFVVRQSKRSHLMTLQIPESVDIIESDVQGTYGGYTFFYGVLRDADVGNIEVASDNKYYSSQDGVLYSKDFTILYRYPKASLNNTFNIINGVLEIYDRAVAEVEALQTVSIPNSVKTINKSAFAYCDNLKNVVMSESVQIIHTDAFEDCPIISDIILPSSLTYIGDDAFGRHDGAYEGANVKCYAVLPPKLLQYKGAEQPFADETLNYGELHVPRGSKNDYMRAPGWKDFRYIYDDLDALSGSEIMSSIDIIEMVRYDLLGNIVGPEYSGMVIVKNSDGSIEKRMQR